MEMNKPYFFKIVIEDYLNQRVRIPTLFVEKELSTSMQNEAVMRATIKGVAGQWPVLLRERTNYTYLEDGWEKVMEDNSLGDHEFLLFRYDGDMCFNLQIFEKNGCERIKALPCPNEENDEKELIEDSDDSHSSPKATYDGEITATRGRSLSLPSQNPQFTVFMKEYHVKTTYILRIPTSFCKKHFPVSGTKMVTLRNSIGEAWEVTAFVNSGTYALCKGWRNFADANKIKPGNEYIFELLSANEMRVKKA